jgi:hypothetical protein
MFKFSEPTHFLQVPEEGASWLRKFDHLKYILAYFIINNNCDVLVPIFNWFNNVMCQNLLGQLHPNMPPKIKYSKPRI